MLIDAGYSTTWKSGCLMVWDATCPDTFAPSYRAHATKNQGRSQKQQKTGSTRSTWASHQVTSSRL